MGEFAEILDDSISAGQFVIPSHSRKLDPRELNPRELDPKKLNPRQLIDLSQLDFDALQAKFNTGYQHTQAEKLKGAIDRKLRQMVEQNKTRINYLEKFQQMIDEYNAGSRNIEYFFNELIKFARDLNAEDKRAISENLTEEELVHYGINKAPVLATPLKGVAPLTERLSVFPITKKTGALFPPTSTSNF